MNNLEFLPISKEDMLSRDWYYYDYLVISGDAYVDHPSFGPVVIARVLESLGFRVAFLAQPDFKTTDDFTAMGAPRYGVFIGAGNLDSMVAHYTAAKKPRSEDLYSPNKAPHKRPDRATIVYANRAREAFGADMPIIIGGLEASLRRFSHYDYWDDKVRRSVMFDCPADLLVYGMGETATKEIAMRLKKKAKPSEIRDVLGTCYISKSEEDCLFPHINLPSFEETRDDKYKEALACKIEYEEHDCVRGKALTQECEGRFLIQNPPAKLLTTAELDMYADLPYTREVHPIYDDLGGVPAIEEVRFSVIHNRGCIGACNFCALAFHQGRMVSSRSHESVIKEVERMTHHSLWKGYVADVGGPTANFRHTSCRNQEKHGLCKNRKCLAPTPCKNLDADHSDYLKLLRKLREIPKVKKVFIRSGIRFDYMMEDRDGTFFAELVKHHISGQLKVAPEHCIDGVLDCMGKPHIGSYEKFMEKYSKLNERFDKAQFVVPYLMSSHPGSTLNDAVNLAVYLNKKGRQPEQVQDFYPTPGTISTCMYHTGLDPQTMEEVYVAKTYHDKALQRALLQWKRPDKRALVIEALKKAGREDLIGFTSDCLVRPDGRNNFGYQGKNPKSKSERNAQARENSRDNKGKSQGRTEPKNKKGLKENEVRVSGRAKAMGAKKATISTKLPRDPREQRMKNAKKK